MEEERGGCEWRKRGEEERGGREGRKRGEEERGGREGREGFPMDSLDLS